MATTSKQLTLEEFLRLPEEQPALEYEDGEITQKVSPKGKHSRTQASIIKLIDGFAEPRRLALGFPELRTTFAGRSYVPDVAVYRWERIPRDQRGEVADDFLLPSDIAIEIGSPGQRTNRLLRRCEWYIANGVTIALLVDQSGGRAHRYSAGEPPQVLWSDDRIDLDPVLPGFDLTVRRLFEALLIPR